MFPTVTGRRNVTYRVAENALGNRRRESTGTRRSVMENLVFEKTEHDYCYYIFRTNFRHYYVFTLAR